MNKKIINNNKGVALILVVSILTVIAITVVSFIFTMRLESRAAANYLWQQKTKYIAEAGIIHAQAVLREDKDINFIDSLEDSWHTTFAGDDVDNNGDGTNDSAWIEVFSKEGVVGRYAILVEDESSKININTAGYHNESQIKAIHGATPFEVSLSDFFSSKGVSSSLAEKVIASRYGADGAPGVKGVDDNQNKELLGSDVTDNDGDGDIDEIGEGIDEPSEFSIEFPRGDDMPFVTPDEIKRVSGISDADYEAIKNEITTYSQTPSVNRDNELQWDVANVDAEQVLDVFLRSGIVDPWQKAVNLVDYTDSNFAQSVVLKSSSAFHVEDQGPNGDWRWVGDHYESKTYGGIKGIWTWSRLDAGEYFLIMHGNSSGQNIGDVTIGALTQVSVVSGESFNLFPSGTVTIEDLGEGKGSITLAIQNNKPLGTTCYLKYIELISAEGKILGVTQEMRGAEGIRINELMVKPVIELPVFESQTPGGDWIWEGSYHKNPSAVSGAAGEGRWIWQDIPDGEYYLTLYGVEDGQVIGDVYAEGALQELMRSGDRFTERDTVTVSAGLLRIDIQNNTTGVCYFERAELSQQPDAEYIELVNVTPRDVSLSGWSLEVSGTDGWPGSIPLGTEIKAYGYLVLAIDKDDSTSGLSGNNISFEDVWGGLDSVQLDFMRSVTTYSDMIDNAPLNGVGEIILRDERGDIVDIQAYSSEELISYKALEKGAPTASGNTWYPSLDLSGATPADKNNNTGMIKEIKNGKEVFYDIEEATIKNQPLANIGEIVYVCNGVAWGTMGMDDIIALADRLTVYSLKLEAEEHEAEEEEAFGWSSFEEKTWVEQARATPNTTWFISSNKDDVGTWIWDKKDAIANGVYSLYIYGERDEAISISLHLSDGSWTPFTPALTPRVTNCVNYGRIEIGMGNAISLPKNELEIQIKNASESGTAHFDYVRLAPLPYVYGKININTASSAVLTSLPRIDNDTAERIIEYRPLGNLENKRRGIGDLLYGKILDKKQDITNKLDKFIAISNLVTVRSNVYQIIATGQVLRNGQVMSEKRIRAVIHR